MMVVARNYFNLCRIFNLPEECLFTGHTMPLQTCNQYGSDFVPFVVNFDEEENGNIINDRRFSLILPSNGYWKMVIRPGCNCEEVTKKDQTGVEVKSFNFFRKTEFMKRVTIGDNRTKTLNHSNNICGKIHWLKLGTGSINHCLTNTRTSSLLISNDAYAYIFKVIDQTIDFFSNKDFPRKGT